MMERQGGRGQGLSSWGHKEDGEVREAETKTIRQRKSDKSMC